MNSPPAPPGWYQDPYSPKRQRFWNGHAWAEYERATPWWRTWWAVVPALLLCLPLGLIGLVAVAMSQPDTGSPSASTFSAPTSSAVATPTAPTTPATTAPVMAAVPPVRGGSRSEARQALRAAGLVIGDVVRRPSARPAGTVLSQSPAPGGERSPGTAVDLVIAAPYPRVPDVVGLDGADARARLRDAGFLVADRTRVVTSGADRTVLAQNPVGGRRLRPHATVTIVISDLHVPRVVQTNCTPGYSPCLPPASDYDCAGGSGNGPEYVYGTETVTGSDPYGLDADGDGYGCE